MKLILIVGFQLTKSRKECFKATSKLRMLIDSNLLTETVKTQLHSYPTRFVLQCYTVNDSHSYCCLVRWASSGACHALPQVPG